MHVDPSDRLRHQALGSILARLYFQAGLRGYSRRKLVQHLARGVLPKPNRSHQVARRSQSTFAGRPGIVGVAEFAQGDFVFARFPIEQLLADFNRPLTLMLVEPMLDLVA